MQRQTRLMHGSVTGYDRDGNILWHSECEQEVYVPLREEPAVFKAFTSSLRSDESILSIAERFDTDHCTVLFWRHRLGLDTQPDIDCWPGTDEGEEEAGHGF